MPRPPQLDTPESDASLSLEGVRARRNSSVYSVGDQSMLASESSLDGQEDIPAMLTLEVERLLAVRWGRGWIAYRQCSRDVLREVEAMLLRRPMLLQGPCRKRPACWQ